MSVFFLLSVSISTLAALIGSLSFGHLSPAISGISLFFGGIVAWKFRNSFPSEEVKTSRAEKVVLLLLAIPITYQFLTLIFQFQGRVFFGNPNNLGDLPMHINMIKALARGLEFWPQNLEFAGEKLRYPFGMNLFNALFESLRIRTTAHLLIVGLFASFVLVRELRIWAGLFGVMAFVASGGFDSVAGLFAGSGMLPGPGVDFKNLFLSVFVTQRGFLWALPVGIFLIRQFQNQKLLNQTQEILLIFLLAISPFFHLHSAVVFFLYFAMALFFHPQKKQWVRICGVAAVLSLPLTLAMLSGGSGQISNSVGWLTLWNFSPEKEINLIEYFVRNFHVLLVILPCLLAMAWKKKDLRLMIPVTLLGLALFVRMAPWPWDNIKILLWAYLLLIARFQKNFPRFQSLAILLFIPGIFQLWGSLPSRQNASAASAPAYFLDCENPAYGVNEAVLASPDFDHPLLFSGSLMTFGYEGHLWSHGYDLARRKALIDQLMQEGTSLEDWQVAAKDLGAKWLYWGQNEEFSGNPPEALKNLKSFPACRNKPLRGDRIYELHPEPSPF